MREESLQVKHKHTQARLSACPSNLPTLSRYLTELTRIITGGMVTSVRDKSLRADIKTMAGEDI